MKLQTLISWGFQWLEVVDKERKKGHEIVTKVRCSLCSVYESQICSVRNFQKAWITGTSNVKRDSAITHKNGDPHKRAELLKRNQILRDAGESPAASSIIGQSLVRLKDKDMGQLKKLFDIAFLVTKEEIPFTKFPALAKMEKKHGVELGETYLTDIKCAEFIENIAEVYENELNELLRQVKVFSILIDGSTDVRNKEKELIYVLFLNPISGRQMVRFFSLKEISPALQGNAAGLVEIIKLALTDHSIGDKLNNIVGMGMDGASVNMGSRGGVQTLFKTNEGMTWLVAVHCISHRLELSLKDSLSKQVAFNDIEDMLLTLYLMYDKSPQKMRQLVGIAEALESSVSTPVKSSGTRWIGHKVRALQWVAQNYRLVMEHLQHMSVDSTFKKDEQVKFKGYFDNFRQAKFPLFIAYYLEILSPAAVLSQQFQKEDIDIVLAVKHIKKFFRILNEMANSDDLLFSKGRVSLFFKNLKPFTEPPTNRTQTRDYTSTVDETDAFKFHEIPITHVNRARQLIDSNNGKILKSVCDSFKQRFENIVESDFFTSAVTILDTEMYPSHDSDTFSQFGHDAVDKVTQHFEQVLSSNSIDLHKIFSEWDDLKELVVTTGLHSLEYRGALAKVFCSSKKSSLENILAVIEILLVIPVSNAVVERGFSCMNRVHTDWRNSLGEKRVEQLMRIIHDGPEPQDFDPEPAVVKWSGKCERRPWVQPYGPRTEATPSTSGGANRPTKRKLPESEVLQEVLERIKDN